MRYENNIKALQTALGLTIDQAADAMGMSRGGYLKIQRGENRLTSTTIALAARAFGVTESDILSNIAAVSGGEHKKAPSLRSRKERTLTAEYTTTVESDGTTTFPPELRDEWGLKPGDRIEFFEDYTGGWQVRPRNAGPLDFLKFLPARPKRSDARSDAEALTRAMAERNLPSATRRGNDRR
jgi:transcriptional regulator with XRE-family HTH domain